MSLFSRCSRLAAAILAVPLAACVSNDGGLPPEGEPISFSIVDRDQSFFCGFFEDSAVLIEEQADIDAVVAACSEEAGIAGLGSFLAQAMAGSTESESLVLVTVALGGCIEAYDLVAVHLDGEVLRPWLLKDDSAYGVPDSACTDDIRETVELLRVGDGAVSNSSELTVGVWNSDLPGSPFEAHRLSPQ